MQTDLLHLQSYYDSGDAGEFQCLVRHHASMVFATARRVTRNASLAEDVSQETFIELARKGRSITESVGAWLHRVAWRRACDAVRAEVTRQRYETAAMALTAGRECTSEALEPVFDEALAELPIEERSVIIEHYLEGRTQTEIAGRMGLSQSSVSRLLEQSMDHLRAKLRAKGLLCGATLGAMIIASASSQAAPASLIAALNKIAVGGVGGTASSAAGGTLLATLLALNFKAVIVATAVLLACAAGYDIASKDSRIARWLEPQKTVTARVAIKPAPVSHSVLETDKAATKARLVAEAKAIWAKNAKKLSKEQSQRLLMALNFERDTEKRFEAFVGAGLPLTRAQYDAALARHPDVFLFDELKSGLAMGKLWDDIVKTLATESPLEIVAWLSSAGASVDRWFRPSMAPWVRSHPEAWAAFVEAGPEPRLADYARLWCEEIDDPGSIWAKAEGVGVDRKQIERCLYEHIDGGTPADELYRFIMRCPYAEVRDENFMAISGGLRPERLLEVANSGVLSDKTMVAALRVLAGDPSASFADAAAWAAKAASAADRSAPLARWTEECASRFYAQWVAVDPQAALLHAERTGNDDVLERAMREGSTSPAVSEALIAQWFSDPKNRDRALAAYFQAKAGGDPAMALRSVMGSSAVQDEIEVAKSIVRWWAAQSAPAAAAWVATMPASEGRAELVATVASQWAEIAPEAAWVFAQQQHAGLAHGLAECLGKGARQLPEEKLAPMLAAMRDDPEYNTMLARLAGHRYPAEAFKMLAKYGAPGWQTPMINDTLSWLEGDDARAENYALQLPAIDLTKVEPDKVSKVAKLLAQRLADKGKLSQALDWTLKLPPAMAPQARSEAFAHLWLGNEKQRTAAEQWIRIAAISEGERAALRQQLSSKRG